MASTARTPQGLDVERYRRRLLELRQQLEIDLATLRQDEETQDGGPSEPGPGQHWEHSGYGDHLADDATELFERERNLTLERTIRDDLRDVEHALQRLAAETYGACEVCGRPIGSERLDAVPEATLCLKHQVAREAAAAR
jgi:DnaK suppressor protein